MVAQRGDDCSARGEKAERRLFFIDGWATAWRRSRSIPILLDASPC